MTEEELDPQFRDEPVTPVWRHWDCPKVCNGEMVGTGQGISTRGTKWQHKCNVCGHEAWADSNYPRIVYLTKDGENGRS